MNPPTSIPPCMALGEVCPFWWSMACPQRGLGHACHFAVTWINGVPR